MADDAQEAKAALKGFTTSQRREWLLEYVKRKTWYVVKTRGAIKQLAELFGVHRHQIENDLKLIQQQASVADIGLIEMDTRHLFSKALVRADAMAEDKTLPESVRARYNAQLLSGATRQAQILVQFGKMDRDMAPPPKQEERPQDVMLDQAAADFINQWRDRNRPKKPEGL
jgi:hypothetical protein